jgi:hypothetical protein
LLKNKLNIKKVAWIILVVVVLMAFIQISVVIGIEYSQHKSNAKRLEQFDIKKENSKTLVVYFSRSGNTELMAYQIAEIKKANIKNLVANEYKMGYKGWIKAMMDARKINAVITPQKMDLSVYDTIYIGSPI